MAIGSRLRHVVESQQFSRALLEELLDRADEIKRHKKVIEAYLGTPAH